MPPFKQEIRGRHHAAVGGGENGGVVADAGEGTWPGRREPGGQGRDKAELTEIGQGLHRLIGDNGSIYTTGLDL
jgi:hypothetical protein